MFTDRTLVRVRRSLFPAVAVLLVAGLVAAIAYGTSDDDAGRGAGAAAVGADGDAGAVDQSGGPGSDAALVERDPASLPLGPSVVPSPGLYRYDVESVRDGLPSSSVDEREITITAAGDPAVVQVVARSDAESQVSVFEWSSTEIRVRSTRIETADGSSRDCEWSPPFTEFGPLVPGSSWTLESSCSTEVAGLETAFAVTGSGTVIGETEIDHHGAPVRVWQIERDRTTVVTATVGSDRVEQQAREVGVLFLDPARGLVVKSDVTVTRSGSQTGQTRRTSVLSVS